MSSPGFVGLAPFAVFFEDGCCAPVAVAWVGVFCAPSAGGGGAVVLPVGPGCCAPAAAAGVAPAAVVSAGGGGGGGGGAGLGLLNTELANDSSDVRSELIAAAVTAGSSYGFFCDWWLSISSNHLCFSFICVSTFCTSSFPKCLYFSSCSSAFWELYCSTLLVHVYSRGQATSPKLNLKVIIYIYKYE